MMTCCRPYLTRVLTSSVVNDRAAKALAETDHFSLFPLNVLCMRFLLMRLQISSDVRTRDGHELPLHML